MSRRAPAPLAPTRSGRRRTPKHSPIIVKRADGSVEEVSPHVFKKLAASRTESLKPKAQQRQLTPLPVPRTVWLEIRRLRKLRGLPPGEKPANAWEAQKQLQRLRRQLARQNLNPSLKGQPER